MIQAHDYQRLAKMMAACRSSFFWALLAMISMAVALAFLPLQIQRILYAAFIARDELLIQTAMLTVIILVVIYSISGYVGQYWMRKADNQFSMQLNGVLFETLLHLPVQHLQPIDRDQVIQAMLSDIRSLSGAGMQVLTVLMRDSFAVLGLVACLVYLSRDIALLVCILLPFVFLMFQVMTGPREKYPDVRTQHNIHDDTEPTDRLRRCLGNIRHIQLFGGQQQACRQLGGAAQSRLDADHQRDNYQAFIALLCQLLIALIAMAMIYLLAQQVIEGTFTIDQAGVFIAIILLLALPLKRLAGISRMLWSMRRQLEQMTRLFDLSATATVAATKNAVGLTEVRGELILERVQCSEKTIQQPYMIDLTVQAGETVALIGDHEKTGLLLTDLLLGFCPPATGQIRLDGHSYAEINGCDLRAQFAVISSTPVMLSDRVAGNIAYGDTGGAHEACITKAVQATGVAHFVREMPEGLQTRVDENSVNLTRRQWQLIAVTRALLKNPPILIIDDLWPQHEKESADDVFKALVQVMQNRTTILLLSAMPVYRKGIDRILRFEAGKLVIPGKD